MSLHSPPLLPDPSDLPGVPTVLGSDGRWLDALPRPVFALDLQGAVLDCNSAAVALLGLTKEDLVGQELAEIAFSDEHRSEFLGVMAHVLADGPWSGALRARVGDGSQEVQAHLGRVCQNGQAIGVVLTVDVLGPGVDRAALLSERLTRLARVSAELQGAPDLVRLTSVVIDQMADAAGATTASLSLVSGSSLILMGMRGARPGASQRWATYPVDDETPAGVAVREKRPVVFLGRNVLQQRFPHLELAADGDRTLLCLPLMTRGEAVGVATLTFPGKREVDAAELEFYRGMADSCAQAIERMRALETVAEQNSKLTLLADVSAELASSLDYESTLGKVAHLAVPDFADWCSISLAQDGILRTLAVAHRDPAKVALAERFQELFPEDPETSRNYEVLATGASVIYPDITDEMIVAGSLNAEHLAMLRALDLHSIMIVALVARERIFGTVTWVRGQERERFDDADLAFGEDLARRAAVAIDNAVLHSELKEVADRLQEAVAPPELPQLAGWELTSCYSSAGNVDVGGDFYEVVPLSDGRLALAIGDVMGRGVHAAAAMTQIRSALRAFIAVNPDPVSVMSRLDMLYDRFPTEQLVTLLYAVADPSLDRLTVVSAGHPPPLMLDTDGASQFVEVQGTILGVEPTRRRAEVVPFRPGQTLVLFTDGLLERRGEDLGQSRDRLQANVSGLDLRRGSPGLARLTQVMCDPTRDDDVAVLVARRT